MNVHTCDLVESWLHDGRLPIRRELDRIILTVDAKTEVAAHYCPFCGECLVANPNESPPQSSTCPHLKEMASKPASSIEFVADDQEFFLRGTGSLRVCLFFCPDCGKALPLHEQESCPQSCEETARLAKLFSEISSIDQAIREFGRPDFERGPSLDFFYWKGTRHNMSCRRFIYYEQLSETLNVQFVEWNDGTVGVKFLPKRAGQPQTGQSDMGQPRV
jgi:hypothetical protein